MPRPKRLTLTLQTPALDNVAQDQTTAGAGNLTLNGSLASGGTVSIATAQRLDIESTGNISGVTFTVTGTDADGGAQTEAITGPNANTVTSTKYFKTITQIAVDGAVGTNTSVGITDEAASQTYQLNRYNHTGTNLAVDISGTINYTVQKLMSNPHSDIAFNWIDISALASKTADTDTVLTAPTEAVRIVVNSYTDGATLSMDITQA